MISADYDLRELNNRVKSVSEADLKNALKKYHLKDALLLLGRYSKDVFSNSDHSMGNAAMRDKSTGMIITQDFLAYLSNILLISGANDFKNRHLADKENNVAVLCDIYHNKLVAPYLENVDGSKQSSPPSLMTLMHVQQISHQKSVIKAIGRNYFIFNTLFKTLQMKAGDTPYNIFFREYGMQVEHYLHICIALWAVCDRDGVFSAKQLDLSAGNNIPLLRGALSQENVEHCLIALSANYKKLREVDTKNNSGLQPVHTKGRFNPLKIYPIVKYESKGEPLYSIPNTTVFFEAAFKGIYFMLPRHFENNGKRPEFTNYFGALLSG